MSDDLRAAVAAGALGSEESYRALLQSIVEVARAIFGARASSIFLLDEDADELVFEAVAGEGADELIGHRFPSSTGIAGWVLVTRQPLVIEDLDERPALRARGRRVDRLRPEGPDGRAAAARGAGARRARGARPPAAGRLLARRRWSCSACSPTRPRSRSTSCRRPARRGRCSRSEGGDARRWRASRRASTTPSPSAREPSLQLLDALEKLLPEH